MEYRYVLGEERIRVYSTQCTVGRSTQVHLPTCPPAHATHSKVLSTAPALAKKSPAPKNHLRLLKTLAAWQIPVGMIRMWWKTFCKWHL